MLFNSQLFILLVLPVALIGWYGCRSASGREWLMILISLAFYGYGDIRFLPILIVLIVMNWALTFLVARRSVPGVFAFSIAANLAVLGYFKYRNFFLETLLVVVGEDYQPVPLLLPIGISFFTFQKIGYLIDLHRGVAQPYGFRRFAFFVTYFPQLIAGPIVRHDEIIPQLAADPRRAGVAERIGRGTALFMIGLIKKIFFADQLAGPANAVFAAAKSGAVSSADAWLGTLSFSLQIYFDFSAYSDMAIGTAMMMGLCLPYNFASPYKSGSIRVFWRRWHMTLSRFLRDYLYIPLGGNRHGLPRQIAAQGITMALCGLWHGANWTFLLWGLWHGAGLIGNVLWARLGRPLPFPMAWLLTIVFVMFGWVLFRAESFSAVAEMWSAMLGFSEAKRIAIESVRPWLLALAAATVLLLPSSQSLALSYLRPYWPAAAALAACLVVILLEIGEGQSIEFIYFAF